MKLTLKIMITTGSLLLLISLAQAQTTIQHENVTRYSDGTQSKSSSSTVIHDYDAERREALAERQQRFEEAKAQAEQQAAYAQQKAEEKARAEQRFASVIAAQNARHDREEANRRMDDDATIASYIKAHGYSEVTSAMIDQLRGYMSAHGLLHVYELPN